MRATKLIVRHYRKKHFFYAKGRRLTRFRLRQGFGGQAAPARSVATRPMASPYSFRRFPNGSSVRHYRNRMRSWLTQISN